MIGFTVNAEGVGRCLPDLLLRCLNCLPACGTAGHCALCKAGGGAVFKCDDVIGALKTQAAGPSGSVLGSRPHVATATCQEGHQEGESLSVMDFPPLFTVSFANFCRSREISPFFKTIFFMWQTD